MKLIYPRPHQLPVESNVVTMIDCCNENLQWDYYDPGVICTVSKRDHNCLIGAKEHQNESVYT